MPPWASPLNWYCEYKSQEEELILTEIAKLCLVDAEVIKSSWGSRIASQPRKLHSFFKFIKNEDESGFSKDRSGSSRPWSVSRWPQADEYRGRALSRTLKKSSFQNLTFLQKKLFKKFLGDETSFSDFKCQYHNAVGYTRPNSSFQRLFNSVL